MSQFLQNSPLPPELDLEDEKGFSGLPSARGNRKALSPLQIDFIRELEIGDIPLLLDPPKGKTSPVVRELKSSHHRLAQLIAEGTLMQEEISLITGYSPAYISRILADPSFASLVSHYTHITEIKFSDVVAQMESVGRDGLEEIQRRIADEPGSFSHRELNEVVELMLVKPLAVGGKAGGGSGTSISVTPVINVTFRSPERKAAESKVIEGERE